LLSQSSPLATSLSPQVAPTLLPKGRKITRHLCEGGTVAMQLHSTPNKNKGVMHENPFPDSSGIGRLFTITGAIAFGAAETARALEQGPHEVERDALRTQGNVSAPGARFVLDRL